MNSVAEQLLEYIAQQNLRPGDRLPPNRAWPRSWAHPATSPGEAVRVLAADRPAPSAARRWHLHRRLGRRAAGRRALALPAHSAWKTSGCSWTTAR
ncbi:hypothetical protein ACRAWF_22555 [Streptomyces sp. L7]